MTTKPPAEVQYTDDKELIKKIYTAVEELGDIIPVINDRNRLSFNLHLFLNKEIDTIINAVQQANPASSMVQYPELERMIVKLFKEKDIL